MTAVVTAFNYAHYLPEAIDSVLAQSYPEIEIIVVDDGSTDATREVVAAYGSRVRYVYQENAGLSAARNTGLRLATSAYVGFLDADDRWLPGMVQRLVETFREASADTVLVACKHEWMDENGAVVPKVSRDTAVHGEITVRDIVHVSRFAADAVVVRRDALLAAGGFDTDLRSSEDRDMWIRLTPFGRLILIPECHLQVRRHADSMSRHGERMKENMRRVLAKAYAARPVPRRQVCFWLRVFAFFHFQTAWMFYNEGRRGTAIAGMTKSLLLWPWFPDAAYLNEPLFFRLRALGRFLLVGPPATSGEG